MDGDGKDFERWRARGDSAALARVFDAQAPALLRFGVHLVGDANAAEDLVQETFLTALRQAERYDAARPIDRWLAGILVRHAQELRREARRIAPHAPPESIDARTPFDDALSADERETIARTLDRLEEPYRSAAVLHVAHGLTAAEIAHALDRSPGAVRVQLHRAREILRKTLPAGIASALVVFLAEPARGLGSVRNQVLQEAARLAPAASIGGGLLGGVLVMKKLAIVAAVVLALAAAWWWTRGPAESVALDTRDKEVASVIEGTSRDAAVRTEPLAPRAETERVLAADLATNPASDLVPFAVRVVDGDSGQPVAGAQLAFFPPKRSTWSELRARWPERIHVDSRGYERVHDWPWFRSKPTARERLDVDPITSYEGPQPVETPIATAISDEQGNAIVALGPEQAFVVAEHPDYATRGMPPELVRTVNWSDGKDSHVDTFRDEVLVVKLHRSRMLRGQLIDLEGLPLAERIALRVEGSADRDLLANGWKSTAPTGSWTVWTNPDGSFEAEIAAQRVSLDSLDPRWSVAKTAVHPVKKQAWHFSNIYALDGMSDGGDVAWIPLSRIPAVVVRSAVDDSPVRDFRMLVIRLDRKSPRGLVIRVRSEDGRASLLDGDDFSRWAEKLGPLGIHVIADGFAPGYVECADPTRADEIVVRLNPGASAEVAGTVLDDGRPVAGASVLLTPSSRGNWDCEDDPRSAGLAASTDEIGRFAVAAPPGGWVVTVAHGARSQCRFVEHPATQPLVIDLARDTVVEFVVEAPPGTSFAKLWAQLHSGNEVNRGVEIDAHGRARFGSLIAGRYGASVHGPEGALEVTPGDDAFDLAADTTRTLHFRITSTNGPRHARLVVDGLRVLEGWKAMSWSVRAQPVAVEPDGFVPIDVGWQPSRVRIEAPDGTAYHFEVPIGSGGEPVLRIARGRSELRGRLLRADGRPQSGRRIHASTREDEHGLEWIDARVDHEGRFRFDALMPGEVTLTVAESNGQEEYDGLKFVHFACRAGAGAPQREITIQLPAGLDPAAAGGRIALSGVARDGDSPAAGRNLWILAYLDSPDGTLQVATTTTVLSDGTYSVSTLPAARHAATTWFEGGKSWSREFTLPLDVTTARQDFALR